MTDRSVGDEKMSTIAMPAPRWRYGNAITARR